MIANEGCGASKISKLSLALSEYTGREFSSSLKIFDKEKWLSDVKNVMHAISVDPKTYVLQFEEQ